MPRDDDHTRAGIAVDSTARVRATAHVEVDLVEVAAQADGDGLGGKLLSAEFQARASAARLRLVERPGRGRFRGS